MVNLKNNRKRILFCVIIMFIMFSTVVFANSYPTATSRDQLVKLMAVEIAKDNLDFKIIYESTDDSIFTQDGIGDLIKSASTMAGPYYELQIRSESYLRVTQMMSTTYLIFHLDYETSKEQINEIDIYVKEVADKILLSTTNDYEIIKKLNDHLKSAVTYGAEQNGIYHFNACSAYGVVKDQIASSSGYAFIIERFMNYFDLESDIVTGTIGSSYEYWNLIKIDNYWYHLDIGENDRTGTDNYLLKSDRYMSASRRWEYEKYPKATMDYDYSSSFLPTPELTTEQEIQGTSLPSGLNENVYKAEEMGLLTKKLIESDLRKQITREEFVEIIMKVYEAYDDFEPQHNKSFIDTTNPSIEMAYELGIVNGISKTEFAPDALLTREQACVILLKLIQLLDMPLYYESVQITDVGEISSWAVDAMNYLVFNKIVSGVGGGNVSPKGLLIREHAIILATNVYNRLNSERN